MVKSVRKSETETFGIVGRFHRFEDLAGKRVYALMLNMQEKKNKTKQNIIKKKKQKNKNKKTNQNKQTNKQTENKQKKKKNKKLAFWVKKETELTQNIQEQVWRMKYLLTEIKWMNIKVKIDS